MPQVSFGRDRDRAPRHGAEPRLGMTQSRPGRFVDVAPATKSPAPLRDAGLVANRKPLTGKELRARHPRLRLRLGRSQRRSYGPWHVRRSRTAETTVESSALTVVVMHVPLAHGVVVAVMASVMTKVGDLEAGEEYGRDDEHDAGHDHDPRRQSVEPIRFNRHGRWLSGDGGRPGWDFWCFAHTWNDAWPTNRVRWVQLMKYL
jgi:hypothetical protein